MSGCVETVADRAVASARDSRWHVLQTKTRQEKALAATLDAAGVSHFLPLTPRVRYHGGRRRIVQAPLFSSYLFVWGPNEAAYFAMRTKRVARFVDVPDQGRLDEELQHLRAALERGGQLDPYPFLTRGRRVRVRAGPFQGVEGLVEERTDADRLVLQIQTLGQATSLEIDADLLEPIE